MMSAGKYALRLAERYSAMVERELQAGIERRLIERGRILPGEEIASVRDIIGQGYVVYNFPVERWGK